MSLQVPTSLPQIEAARHVLLNHLPRACQLSISRTKVDAWPSFDKDCLLRSATSDKMNSSVSSVGTNMVDEDLEATSLPVSANNWWTTMLLNADQSQPSPSAPTIQDLETLNWSSDLSTSAVDCDAVEHPSKSQVIQNALSTITTDCHQQIAGAGSSPMVDSSLSAGSGFSGGVTDSSVWSQVLMGSAGSEAMQSLNNGSAENMQDVLYSRIILHQGNQVLLPDYLVKKIDDMPNWGVPLKNFAFHGGDTPPLRLLNDHSTCLSNIETCLEAHHHSKAVSQSMPIHSGLDFPTATVKQEYPIPYGSTTIVKNTCPVWFQSFDDKGDMFSSQLLAEPASKPFVKNLSTGLSPRDGDDFVGRFHAESCKIPLPALTSKQPSQMQTFGNSINQPHPFHSAASRPDVMPLPHGKYVHQPVEVKALHDGCSHTMAMGLVEEASEMPSDSKRQANSTNSCDSSSDGGPFKRPRIEPAHQTLPFKQVRKEKLGDRITALQQLVSPFGKTDTASVLLEAIRCIKVLQEQVQVLSTPYMKCATTTATQNDLGNKPCRSSDKNHDPNDTNQDLKSRGLCLVPVSCTLQVANENGADYWAPSLARGYR